MTGQIIPMLPPTVDRDDILDSLKSIDSMLRMWRFVRDGPYQEHVKKVATAQVDLLQSAKHNIEHELFGIKCNCQRVDTSK